MMQNTRFRTLPLVDEEGGHDGESDGYQHHRASVRPGIEATAKIKPGKKQGQANRQE